MLKLDKIGTISFSNKIVCNRASMTPEMFFSANTKISVKYPTYTISKMTKGILLSFFSIPGKFDQAWFIHNERSYFLSSLNKIDGHLSYWKGNKPFGEILNKDYLMALDTRYAWTFFLCFETLKYTLMTLWDILDSTFIHPENWPKFLDSNKWWSSKTSAEKIFKCDGRELNFLAALKKKFVPEEAKLTYPEWIKSQYESCNHSFPTNVISESDEGIPVLLNEPMLITLYYGNQIFTVKIIAKEDVLLQMIAGRSQDKYEALFIAIMRGEDTSHFEEKYFTPNELYTFEERLKRGKKIFFKQIFEKDVLKKYTIFPDKIYNTIHLGAILNTNKSFQDKQHQAWTELTRCRGWRSCAILSFYETYMKN